MNANFLDTSVLLYLISENDPKANAVERLLLMPSRISVQVLNEFAAVARRKYDVPWPKLRSVLGDLTAVVSVEPLTFETHQRGLAISERYRLHIYDSLLLAAALLAGSSVFYSEDLQHRQAIENLTIRNPFLQ